MEKPSQSGKKNLGIRRPLKLPLHIMGT